MTAYAIAMSNAHTAPTATPSQAATAYRIQAADRDLTDLLDPEQQYSFPMDGDDEKIRRGVSGCETLSDLAAYIASHAIEAHCPVLVRITGPLSDDTPCDEDDGEVLLLPTGAEIISDDNDFFALVSDLVDLHMERGLDCSELREIASERI